MTPGILLNNYLVTHTVRLPAKVTDYDYSANPLSRFASTIIHELGFYDKITGEQITKFQMTSEVVDRFIITMQAISQGTAVDDNLCTTKDSEKSCPIVLTLPGVYIEGFDYPIFLVFNKISGHIRIRISKSDDLEILITLMEAQALQLLLSEEQ